jgi:hypothetical protein
MDILEHGPLSGIEIVSTTYPSLGKKHERERVPACLDS